MRIRSTIARVAIPAVAIGMILTGCGGSTTGGGGTNAIVATNDINPKDVSELRDGGNLRIPIGALPTNFNYLTVDGNTQDVASVIDPLMPEPVTADAAGNLSVNHDYFTDIKLTGTDPQQVTYTINPKAVWSDGTPITWEDLQSQATALSGADKTFLLTSTAGFDRVAKVERGVDDKQAIVTFSRPYSGWEGQFGPLYPKSVTSSPDAFNNSLASNLPVSAGPFVITNIDRSQNRITLGRNPKWWGATPKLDTITFVGLDDSAVLPALQNNEIDYTELLGLAQVTTARTTPGVAVRRTPEPTFGVLTFNGAPGSILEDKDLRLAVSKAIDRQAIINMTEHGIVDNPKPLNNHIFMVGQKGYQDNSAPSAFDPDKAAAELDALGWKLNGDTREKDGKKLELHDILYDASRSVDIAKIVQQNLAKVGVKLDIQTVPANALFHDYIDPGNFDIASFSWGGSTFPIGALEQIYAYDPANTQGNKGRVGSPELNAKIEQAMAELDPDKAIELANECDQMIWAEGFSLPLIQRAGTYAVRDNLANIGASGLASTDWTTVGFVK